MGAIVEAVSSAFRDFVTEGVASSGLHEPVKSEIRAIGPLIEDAIGKAGLGSLVDVVKTTRALLDADLAHPANTVALVYADATQANNDLYVKTGASGAGGWTLTGALHGVIDVLAGPYVDAAEAARDAALAAPLGPVIKAMNGAVDMGAPDVATVLDTVEASLLLNFTASEYRSALSYSTSLAALGIASVTQAAATWTITVNGAVAPIAANGLRVSPRGWVVESAATNLLCYPSAMQTHQFPGWRVEGNNVTVQTGISDPAGGTGAVRIRPTTANNFHRIHQTDLITLAAGNAFTCSGFFKADGYRRLNMNLGAATSIGATFDLVAGTVLSTGVGAGNSSQPTAGIIALAGGWHYCWMAGGLPNAANMGLKPALFLSVLDDAGNTNFAGDGTKGIQAFQPMVNLGLKFQSWLDSAGTPGTRAADGVSVALPAGASGDTIKVTYGDGTPSTVSLLRSALAASGTLNLASDGGAPWLNSPIRRIELIPAATVTAAATAGGTAALRASVRANGVGTLPATRLAANDTPTLTLGAGNAASTINGALWYLPAVNRLDPRITYTCGPVMLFTNTSPGWNFFKARGPSYGGTFRGATSAISYEVMHNGTQLEIALSGNGGSGTNVRVLVNGAVAGTAAVPNNTSQGYYLKLVFPTSANRKITVETSGVPVNGINVASSAEITSTGAVRPLVTVLGDSFTEGTGSTVGEGEALVMARALGFDCALAASGGTGMLNPGSGRVPFTDPERLLDLTLAGITSAQTGAAPADPKMGIVFGTMNDHQMSPGSFATLREAITNATHIMIDAWVAARPGRPLVFFGPTWPSGPPNNRPPVTVYNVRDGIMAAALSRSNENVWYIDRLMPHLREGVWNTASDMASLYTGSDGTHATVLGNQFNGMWYALQLRSLILGQLG